MQDISSDSDADLLVFMSMGDEDPAAAREAWAEFYERHAEYLHAVCWHAYSDLLHGAVDIGDLVAETFRKAFDRAASFSCEDNADPDGIRRRVRAWLGRIAQRLVQDILRGRGRLQTVTMDPEAWERLPNTVPTAPPVSDDLNRVHEALEQLSEREQLIIRVTFQWHRPNQQHQRLPNHIVEELAATLKTTPENLRQIRRRALERIRSYLKRPQHAEEISAGVRA